MKQIVILGSILATTLFSAQKKVEVSASYGASSMYGISETMTNAIIDVILIPTGDEYIYSSKGVLAIDVMLRNEGQRLAYGLGYTHESVTDDSKGLKGSLDAILAQASYKWLNPSKKFNFYSGAGIGASFGNFKDNRGDSDGIIFAFNVTPIGLRYGSDLSFFIETNIGVRGFLQGGISYQF